MTTEPKTPTKTFRDFDLDDVLVDALEAQGITSPFPIQELTLPMAIEGHDIIGQARTGTGKTLGFGLPLLQRIDVDTARTQALVVVPTRELCLQVADDLTIGEARGIRIQTVYGGVGYDEQIEALTTGVHVVVGTPGRLLDHLNKGVLDLRECRILVLDEADEMLDMGFLPDVERLIAGCPSEGRHTMLFSATMPSAVVKLARRYMTHPTFMRADVEEHETAPTVEQHFLMVHRMDKPRVLARILQTPERGNVYVFTRTKRMADRLVEELDGLGVDAIAVHGDLRQAARERNMERFREGEVSVLVATEVAARGLDVSNVSHVVNYDCPDDEKMYLHRIGRTARAGASGVAVTFAEFNEADRLKMIRKAVGAEHDVLEVFSTSDELTELFGLPDERPWDHLAKQTGDRGSRSSGSGSSDGRRTKRQPSTDGRPKSSRSSEGGGERSRSRRDGGSERGGHSDARSSRSNDGERSSRSKGGDRESRSGGDDRRSRSRGDDRGGRSRDRSTGKDASPAVEVATSPAERDEQAEEVRTRTRARPRSGERGSGDSSGGRQRARAERRRDDDGPDERAGSGSSSSRERSSDRGGGSDESSRRSSGRSSSGRSSDRSSKGSSRGSDRSGSRGGSKGRSDDRASDDRRTNGTVRATSSGPEARGDGDPQLARRVKVEHLP